MSLHQHGCTITADGGPALNVTSTPPCPVAKSVVLDVACKGQSTCIDTHLPAFVSSLRSAYGRGKPGTFNDAGNVSKDQRALENPSNGSAPRGIGKWAEGVILAVDIDVSDPAKEYQLAVCAPSFHTGSNAMVRTHHFNRSCEPQRRRPISWIGRGRDV